MDNNVSFISLGSGSSGNCYMLFTADEALIIDVGVGLRTLKKHFKDMGLSLPPRTAILVTHDHADHVKSVGAFSHEYKLPVFTTRFVHQGIDRNYSIRHKVDDNMRKYIEPGNTYTIGCFKVTPFSVPHDSTDCVGYCVEHNGINFCIATDVGHVTDEIKQYISRANYLVLEANHDEEMLRDGNYPEVLKTRVASDRGHLSNKLCGIALAENMTENLHHAWLCHLSEENNHPELARKTVEQVLRGYGIVAGADFKLDVLKRKVPSEIFTLL